MLKGEGGEGASVCTREREIDREREREREIDREREREREKERQRDCLSGFLASSSTTRLPRGRIPRLTSDNYKCCHTRDRVGRP